MKKRKSKRREGESIQTTCFQKSRADVYCCSSSMAQRILVSDRAGFLCVNSTQLCNFFCIIVFLSHFSDSGNGSTQLTSCLSSLCSIAYEDTSIMVAAEDQTHGLDLLTSFSNFIASKSCSFSATNSSVISYVKPSVTAWSILISSS